MFPRSGESPPVCSPSLHRAVDSKSPSDGASLADSTRYRTYHSRQACGGRKGSPEGETSMYSWGLEERLSQGETSTGDQALAVLPAREEVVRFKGAHKIIHVMIFSLVYTVPAICFDGVDLETLHQISPRRLRGRFQLCSSRVWARRVDEGERAERRNRSRLCGRGGVYFTFVVPCL